MTFVLDNSVALAWCFEDEQTPAVMKLLDRVLLSGCYAPALWPVEAVNSLLMAERRQRITPSYRAQSLLRLAALPVVIDYAERGSFTTLDTLARQYKLTAYDASYLALALGLNVPLATRDKALIAAARSAGVPLLETL
ncbi:type II toxin-antitoxin system VapC family toxin [Acidisoma silvae]|uniref:Type II toxin-antitoxin system VapC family toxin n=1 Tax=Acidisoma silvae TaxID=2802396 RepID=A0A963YTW1_9PROT|nr:type II toxin-antitoxin system VapC family toxin [Acidisoma silvae]MCB8876350.1 type II toxin-antitoxin system VapC family toxin [Acidisoma silvae]